MLTDLSVRRVAIERLNGLLVERLLAAGLLRLPVNSNRLKAARGESDSFDAFCLAELA